MVDHSRVVSKVGPSVTSRPGVWRTGAILFVGVLSVLTACSSGSKTGGAGNRPSASTKPVSAGRRILEGIRPDGTVPLLVAEQAFSLAVAPLPGVTIPPGPHDDTLFSGTAPVRWLRAHRNELTPAQHRVADPWFDRQAGQPAAAPARMPLGARATAETVAFVVGARPERLPTVATDQQRYEAAVAQVLPVLATHFGPLGFDVPVVIDPNSKGTAFALASGGHTSCTLSVFPKGHFASGSDLKFLVAHELTHCFQDRDTVDAQVNSSSAAWVIEGGASWAGLEVSGPTNLMIGHWDEYLLHPETPLFSRSYDGVGFFAHLKESGTDPWPVLIPMINATDNPGRYANAVGGNASTFEDSWASGMFRGQPMSGKDWNTTGVGVPNSRATPQQTSVGHDVDAPSWTVTTAEATTKDEVTSIRAGGSVRVGSGAALDQVVASGTTLDLCTKEGGCTCPPGSKGSPPTAVATSPISIAVTGNAAVSSAHVTGSTLDAFCKRPRPVAAPASGTGACRFLSAAEINHITGLHVGPGVERGDACIFVDPAQLAASPNLNMAAAVLPKVLGLLPAGPACASVAVIGSSDGVGDGSGDGDPPGCESFDPGVGRTARAFACPDNGLGFAFSAGRSVASLMVMYFPSVPGVAGLNTAITSLISTAVSHD